MQKSSLAMECWYRYDAGASFTVATLQSQSSSPENGVATSRKADLESLLPSSCVVSPLTTGMSECTFARDTLHFHLMVRVYVSSVEQCAYSGYMNSTWKLCALGSPAMLLPPTCTILFTSLAPAMHRVR